MRSPFAIFRKHQRVLMVILVGLAMFAFIFMDQMSKTGGQGLIPILGIMLGAGVFWIIGTQTGKPSTYAFVGAVLGGVLGVLFFRIGGPPGAVETNVGSITPMQLQRLVSDRRIANQFVQQAYQTGFPFPQVPESGGAQFYQFMVQMWQQGMERALFRINPRRSAEEDVVLGYLLRQKAKELGVRVSDATVTAHIKQLSQGKMSTRDFRELLKGMGLSEQGLYDILRDELTAQMALNLLAPGTPRTPEQYWEDYRKLNVRQTLEVAAVPVSAFVPGVGAPSDEELRACFEKYKEHFPGQLGPAEPGFRQPRRMRLAYLEADYATIEKEVAKVTDEEVQKYYEDNKDALYKKLTLPDDLDEKDSKKNDTQEEEKSGTKEEQPKEKDSAAADTDAGDKKEDAKKTEGSSPAKDGEVADAKETAEKASKSESKDAATPKKDKGADSKTSEKEEKNKPEAAPAPPKKDGKTPDDSPAASEKTPAKPPEHRPLDDELKLEIRDRLQSERVLAEIRDRIDKAVVEMRAFGYRQSVPKDDSEYLSEQQIREQLQAYAKEHGLRYDETPPLSARELHESEEYPIGQSAEPVANPFERQNAQTVVERLFGAENIQLFAPDQSEDHVTNNRFAYWPIEEISEHVPTLEEPGVKAQVQLAWESIQAQPKAEARANELAEFARKAEQKPDASLADFLADQTATGAKDGVKLNVVTTPQFSWLSPTAPSAPALNPLQPPPGPPVQTTDLAPVVTGAGTDFMKEVFDGLREGEIGVTAATDRTAYYVVRVKERSPAEQGEDSSLKKGFLDENLFQSRAYQHLWNVDRSQTYLAWLDQFEKSHEVRWNRNDGKQ